eukprot:14890754-Ditylum_brightwellii.AAC.1
MNNFAMIFEKQKPGNYYDNAHTVKHCTNPEINSCVQNGVKKALKRQQKNNDSISNEGTNVINKLRSLSINDNNRNDKGKPKSCLLYTSDAADELD